MSNKIIGNPKIVNSEIRFKGKNNILYCEEGITIKDSYINFEGNNSLIFLSKNRHIYYFQITIYHNSVCYFGKNNYSNKKFHIIISEEKNVFIGDECLFAIDCWIRTADPHIIYNFDKKRINHSKSVYIGDHVWCGQNVLIFKGSKIGSGCIIGGGSVVPAKKLFSNSIYAGNPVKLIKSDVFHSKKSVNFFEEDDSAKYDEFIDDRWIYKFDDNTLSFDVIEEEILKSKDVNYRLDYLKSRLNKSKNRFYMGNK